MPPRVQFEKLSSHLVRSEDGIWYSRGESRVSYPEEGAERCAQVEDASFWFEHRNRCIVALAAAHPPPHAGAVFDVGGGNGYVARGLADAGFEVVLLEPSASGARVARQRGLRNVVCSTLEEAEFPRGSLPAIGLFDVVEHMEDDVAFMKAVHSLLDEGGRLYVTVPAYPFLWSRDDVATGHFRRYTLRSLARLLSSVGFEVEHATYVFRFLPIPIFALRTLPSWLGLARDPMRQVPRDHASAKGLARRLLDGLLAPEIRRVQASRPMRFGASCLVAATRK